MKINEKKEIITMLYPNNIFIDENPSSFNGWVRIRKYKITIEEVDEPNKVLCERLEKLWVEETNYHQRQPLEAEAKKLGYKFKKGFRDNKLTKRK